MGGRERRPPAAALSGEEVGTATELRRDLRRQHRPPGGVLLHQHPAGVIALGQNPRRQIGFRLDAAIEILVGSAAAPEIEDNRKDGDAEDERGGVPDGHPRANTLHDYARTTYPTPRTG